MLVICIKLINVIKDVKFINNFFFLGGTIFGFVFVSSFLFYWYICVCYLLNFFVLINLILYYMNEIVRYYCIIGYLSIVNINRVCFILIGSFLVSECYSYFYVFFWYFSFFYI